MKIEIKYKRLGEENVYKAILSHFEYFTEPDSGETVEDCIPKYDTLDKYLNEDVSKIEWISLKISGNTSHAVYQKSTYLNGEAIQNALQYPDGSENLIYNIQQNSDSCIILRSERQSKHDDWKLVMATTGYFCNKPDKREVWFNHLKNENVQILEIKKKKNQ